MNILIAGDFCPQARVKTLCEEGKFSDVLGEAKAIVEKADFSIVNFECPVTWGEEKPIEKKGPNLRCFEKGVEALKWAGFDCVTLANNHLLDFGAKGVGNTIETCRKYGIETVGGGMNLKDASQTLYKTIGEKTLAIINCCEHEFSIATTTTAGANPLNSIQQFYAIKEARTKADYVLVIVHGGHEHWQLPSTRMQETYRFFIDAGADAVVNHHQHCFSGYEIYKAKPIFYGLGNFCFDAPKVKPGIWNEGYMLQINLNDNLNDNLNETPNSSTTQQLSTFNCQLSTVIIHPYLQCMENPCVKFVEPTAYNKRLEELNGIIADPEQLRRQQREYYRKDVIKYKELFEPLDLRLFRALRKRGWMPSLISKRRRLMAKDFIECESHRDRLIYHINN